MNGARGFEFPPRRRPDDIVADQRFSTGKFFIEGSFRLGRGGRV
jgi:hypothetical protein